MFDNFTEDDLYYRILTVIDKNIKLSQEEKKNDNNSKKILILGGQGNGGVIANAIQDAYNRGYTEWICEGFLNDGENHHSQR